MLNNFIENKYTKWYLSIIEQARKRVFDSTRYTERHHIIPRSLGGSDRKGNLVRLYAKEHFIVHLLLTKMLDGGEHRNKMIYAFHAMRGGNDKRYKTKIFNCNLYESIRTEYSRAKSERTRGRPGIPHSDETRKKISELKSGVPLSLEHKRKISEAHQREECKERSRQTHVGMKGKTHSLETIERMQIAARKRVKKECPHCGKVVSPGIFSRYHGNNCKFLTTTPD